MLQKMITVILPSKNEEKSIGHVTKVADIALQHYFPHHLSVLLNVNSVSNDKTVEAFLSTHTVTPKKSIQLPKEKLGKGYNLKDGIDYGLSLGSEYFITLDTDVKSIEPYWIKSQLHQVIDKHADFVSPIYRRNRFEGNTTNHFSSPLVYACWNKDIQQPIAGDFAFSKRQAKSILDSFSISVDYRYGIDTLMTWCALSNGYDTEQVNLGSKIHSPSFSKLPEMFKEVCASSFYRINRFRDQINHNVQEPMIKAHDILTEEYYKPPPDLELVNALSRNAQALLKKMSFNFVVKDIDSNVWTDHLSASIKALLGRSMSAKEIHGLTKQVSPFYYARVVNYIEQASTMNPKQISDHLNDQKILLAEKLRLTT